MKRDYYVRYALAIDTQSERQYVHIGVCVCLTAVTRVLAVLGVRGPPVRHEARGRPELRTLSPTALVFTSNCSSLRRVDTIGCG